MNTVVSAPAHRLGADVLPSALAALSGVAAGIHAWVTPEHVEEYWLFGAFFAAVTVFQVAWATAIALHPSRSVAVTGMVASASILLVWALSRTAGLPVGPEPWTTEPVGALDVLAGLAEVAIVGFALLMTRSTKGKTR